MRLPPTELQAGVHKVDWLLIGGGITGLAAAHSLASRFPAQRIVLLDR